jgi:hypothetical protein
MLGSRRSCHHHGGLSQGRSERQIEPGEVERLPEVIGGQAAVALRIWSAGDAAPLSEALQVSEEDFSDWLPGVLKDTADIGEFLQAARALFEEVTRTSMPSPWAGGS